VLLPGTSTAGVADAMIKAKIRMQLLKKVIYEKRDRLGDVDVCCGAGGGIKKGTSHKLAPISSAITEQSIAKRKMLLRSVRHEDKRFQKNTKTRRMADTGSRSGTCTSMPKPRRFRSARLCTEGKHTCNVWRVYGWPRVGEPCWGSRRMRRKIYPLGSK
jgi:hypothetical protein